MNISIQLTDSTNAIITIDGRVLTYGYRRGGWSFKSSLTEQERENTIGGIVADKLSFALMDILQGYMPEKEFNPKTGQLWLTWDQLTPEVADEVAQKISP